MILDTVEGTKITLLVQRPTTVLNVIKDTPPTTKKEMLLLENTVFPTIHRVPFLPVCTTKSNTNMSISDVKVVIISGNSTLNYPKPLYQTFSTT